MIFNYYYSNKFNPRTNFAHPMPTCDDNDVDCSSFCDCLEPSKRETSVGKYLSGFSDGGNYCVYALACNTHRVVVRKAPFLRVIQVQTPKTNTIIFLFNVRSTD